MKTSDLINKFFSKEEIDHLARESGFLMRKRKLSGSSFIDLLVYNQHSLARQSLNDTCVTYLKRYNKDLSKQALAQRFNDKAIGFLKLVIGQLVQKQVNTSNLQWHKLLHFKRVLIKDSTCFQVDQTLCQYFPGSGGSSSKAAVRIQFEYDVMCGEITELEIVPFNNQDLKNARETVGQLDEGTLVIRDLGYVSTEVLQGTDHAGAFFLCRLPPHKKIYEKIDGKAVEVNFSKVIIHLKKNDIERVVKQVYLCKNMKVKLNICISLIPEDHYNERIRKANKQAVKKGRKLTEKYKRWAQLNIFCSNAGTEKLAPEDYMNVYKTRWQIELVFKIWKSTCHLEKVKKVGKNRLLAYLYGRLLLILICWKMSWVAAYYIQKEPGKMLSFHKGIKTLVNDMENLRVAILGAPSVLKTFITQYIAISYKYHLLEKRKDRIDVKEILVQL